jgi:hypothetical protein
MFRDPLLQTRGLRAVLFEHHHMAVAVTKNRNAFRAGDSSYDRRRVFPTQTFT